MICLLFCILMNRHMQYVYEKETNTFFKSSFFVDILFLFKFIISFSIEFFNRRAQIIFKVAIHFESCEIFALD